MGLGMPAAPLLVQVQVAGAELHLYRTPLTAATFIVCAVAACGGLLFGYDLVCLLLLAPGHVALCCAAAPFPLLYTHLL